MSGMHRSHQDTLAESTANELDRIAERLDELIEWGHDEGYPAIAHKLEEAVGRVRGAEEAARQYHTGELTRREA